MAASLPVVVFFVANIIYCLAYLVTDMVWLRILTIVAALCTFPYFIFQTQVMYSAVFWQSAFMLINVFNLVLIYLRRRPVPLSDRESLVKSMVFRHFTSRETADLLKTVKWCDAPAGRQIMAQDDKLDKLYLLYAGKIAIIQNGQVVAHRGPGSFIGEIGYMTNSAATADVICDEAAHYVEWDVAELRAMMGRKAGLRSAFESLLAVNVASKLGTFQQPQAA